MAKKKIAIQMLKKGQRCKEGWTSIEIKIGKTVRRACVRGKVSKTPSAFSKATMWTWAVAEGVFTVLPATAKMLLH